MQSENWVSKNSGWLAIWALSLFPISLWLLAPTPKTSLLTSLGQISALVGVSMFSLNLILSARLRWLEKYFDGLNRVYDRHSQLGQIAFILLLVHPLLILPKYAAGSRSAALKFLFPVNGLAQNSGWLALSTMIILIILTLYLRPRYDLWKLTHKFFGLAFAFAAIHIILIPSDTTVFFPLKLYLLILVAFGTVAYTYHSLLSHWLETKYQYVITNLQKIAANVIQITLAPAGSPVNFNAGQFLFISFQSTAVGPESHPFSPTSTSSAKEITLSVKQSGDFTKKLDKLKVGDKAELSAPFGTFDYQQAESKNQVWVAGGIGITPFLSLAKTLPQNPDYHVDLYYCVRNKSEAIHVPELKALSPALRLIFHFSDTLGRINADIIQKNSGSLQNKSIFLCAPPAMIRSLKAQLLEKGISSKMIHSEEFSLD